MPVRSAGCCTYVVEELRTRIQRLFSDFEYTANAAAHWYCPPGTSRVTLLLGLWSYRDIFLHYLRWRPAVVLWIRRFNQGPQSRDSLRFIELAVGPWGHLVTLADSEVTKGWFFHAILSRLWTWRGLWVPVASLTFGVAMTFEQAIPGLNDLASIPKLHRFIVGYRPILVAAWFLYYSVGIGAFTLGLFHFVRSRSSKLLEDHKLSGIIRSLNDIDNVVRRTTWARFDRLHFFGLSTVYTCPTDRDDIWRAVVTALIPECDLVLVGGGEISPNLQWEIDILKKQPWQTSVLIVKNESDPETINIESEMRRSLSKASPGEPQVLRIPTNMSTRCGIGRRNVPALNEAIKLVGLAIGDRQRVTSSWTSTARSILAEVRDSLKRKRK